MQKVKNAAKKVAQVAKEATEAAERASYERGAEDTKNKLVKEVAEACRDYCTKTWIEVLNSAGVPADFELRKAESIFFLEISEKLQRTFLPLLYPTLLLSRSPVSKILPLMLKPS